MGFSTTSKFLNNHRGQIDSGFRYKLSTQTIPWTRALPATAIPPAASFKTAAKIITSSARRGTRGGGEGRSTGDGCLCDLHQAINFILSKSFLLTPWARVSGWQFTISFDWCLCIFPWNWPGMNGVKCIVILFSGELGSRQRTFKRNYISFAIFSPSHSKHIASKGLDVPSCCLLRKNYQSVGP